MFSIGLTLLVPNPQARADDTYSPSLATQCQVSVPTAVVTERIVLRVEVSASSVEPPTGDVKVVVDSSSASARTARAAAPAWSVVARYDGSPLRIVGPRLPRGSHVAKVVFTPDAGAYEGCRDTVRFTIGDVRVPAGGPDGSGELPDTGGPPLMALVAGAAMVVVGSGMVRTGRTRRRAA